MAVASPLLKTSALLILMVLTIVGGCASGPPAAQPVQAPAPRPAVDASYDWHRQVIAPFGTLLKSSPVPLHEVLLFRDEAPSAVAHSADAENKDCYAIDGPPPRLVGQTPDAYLLCFDHDRLNRIESTVHLAAEGAAQVLAQACASWQTDVAPLEPTVGTCEGRSGSTTFKAHLATEPGQPATLSLVLLNANPVP